MTENAQTETPAKSRWVARITYVDGSFDDVGFDDPAAFARVEEHVSDVNLIEKIEVQLRHRKPIGKHAAFRSGCDADEDTIPF